MTTKNKYYIKENILYSSKFEKFVLPFQDYDEISIPNQTKNHLTNNQIIIAELNKVSKKTGKEIKLSERIKSFNEMRAKIEKAKNNELDEKTGKEIKFDKPKDDDYEFIEKTAQIDLLKSLLKQYEKNSSFDEFESKLKIYLKYVKKYEEEKDGQLREQIEIENEKKRKYETKKKNYIKINIKPIEDELNLLIKSIDELKVKETKFNKELENAQSRPKSKNSLKLENNRNEQNRVIREIKNLKLEIKILNAQIQTTRDDVKMGKKYCPNIWLAIFTIGLIFYTKYSTCKYDILRKKNKINKKKEKILKLEKKHFNLDDENEEIIKKEQGVNKINVQIEIGIVKKLDKLEKMIDKKQREIQRLEKSISKYDKNLAKFDLNIEKINSKLVELNNILEEFDMHSSKRIEKLFGKIVSDKNSKVEYLKELKKTIEEQKIKIDGEFIVEF